VYSIDKQKQQFNCRKTHTTVTQMIQLLYTLGEPVSKFINDKNINCGASRFTQLEYFTSISSPVNHQL